MNKATKEDIANDVRDTLKVLFHGLPRNLDSLGQMTLKDLEWLSASLDDLWSEVRAARELT